MAIDRIHSFLIHPSKNEEEPPAISGTQVTRRAGQVYTMLSGVFDRAPVECDIEIAFTHAADGRQQNDCRDLLIEYIEDTTVFNGRAIANRLQAVSTNRSGLGLLFLMKGSQGDEHQLVISRFPADQGVIAQEKNQQLSVEFIDRVFMKSAKAYKSAYFNGDSLEAGFWDGLAVDRQISGPRELSDYWIQDFLAADLRTTGPAGTRRVAVALKQAISSSGDPAVRHELMSAANLMRGQHGARRSARQIMGQLGLSPEAVRSIEAAFPRQDLIDEVFQFDREEFQRQATYRAVELDNGALMIAEDARFAQVFHEERVAGQNPRTRYTTEGRIVEESLRKSK
jgi:hypothetical protein